MGVDAGRWPGDLHVAGAITADAWNIGTGVVADSHIAAAANIDSTKLNHQDRHVARQDSGVIVATKTHPLFLAAATGLVISFKATLLVACIGAATVVLVLKKNGVSIMSATMTLDNSIAAYSTVTASLAAGAAYVSGDVFEVLVTATAGGGTLGQGLLCSAQTREQAA